MAMCLRACLNKHFVPAIVVQHVHACACGINKRCNKRGLVFFAVVMKQRSVAGNNDRDGAELCYCVILETQTAERNVSGLRRTETDGWTD